jgi:hypothetical protein
MLRLLAGVAFLALGAAPDRDARHPAPADKPAGDQPVRVGTLLGVVQDPGHSSGTLGLKVTLRTLEPNLPAQAAYVQRYQQLLARQAAILRNPNPAQRQQQLAALVQDALRLLESQKDLFRLKEIKQDVELPLAEGVKVRCAVPPQAFDDKGNIKRYTPRELKEMRGTENLPGYSADLSDLQVGQTVLVRVAARRPAPPPKPAAKEPAGPSQKDAPPPPEAGKPLAVLILIADPMR